MSAIANAQTVTLPQLDRLAAARQVLNIEVLALKAMSDRLNQSFELAIDLLLATQGRVIITGMGKSGQVGRKIAATFSSTGTPAYFLHPAEGSHGDVGIMMSTDVVIAISNSGETPELLNILPVIKRMGLPLIAMTGNEMSTLGEMATITLDISVPQEACPMNLAPTASTTATIAMGDALAIVLLKEKGFSEKDFALVHPAGALGKRLLYRVQDLMHVGHALPIIPIETPFLEALLIISQKRLGLGVVVTHKGELSGILTDGDVRRALNQRSENPKDIPIRDVMTKMPQLIESQVLAVEALHRMQAHQITALVIVDANRKPIGVIHLHDLLKAGIV